MLGALLLMPLALAGSPSARGSAPLFVQGGEGCPPNRVEICYRGVTTTAAAFDTVLDFSPSCWGEAAYDLRMGTAFAFSRAGYWSCYSMVRSADRFRIAGLAPGTRLDFRVELRVKYLASWGLGGGTSGSVRISAGASSTAEVVLGEAALDTVVSVDVAAAVGDTLPLTCELYVSAAERDAAAITSYRFVDLPPGAAVVSCQGYAGGGVPELDTDALRFQVSRAGRIAYDPLFGLPWFEYPRGSGQSPVFASGLWVGARVLGVTRLAVTDFRDEFAPGTIVNGHPDNPNRPEYRIFELCHHYASSAERDSALATYTSQAVPFGAPLVGVLPDGDLDITGDQMLWHVYNDADSTAHTSWAGSTAPLNLEVRQTAFVFDRAAAAESTVFLRFRIVNKGQDALEDAYACLWADVDIGGAFDDLAGCDSTLGLGYCYNASESDAVFGAAAPAFGVLLLRGPADAAGLPLGLTSFMAYTDDVTAASVAYNFMRGLSGDGSPRVDPTTGIETPFACPGDPLAGTGWLDSGPGDRRIMACTGPFRLEPGASDEIVVALVVSQGEHRLASVSALRASAALMRRFYESGFDILVSADVSVVESYVGPVGVRLVWLCPSRDCPVAAVQRQALGEAWRKVGTVSPDGSRRLVFEDHDVIAGERYGYRLAIREAGGERFVGETWIDVPRAPTFALLGPVPNPAGRTLEVAFSLAQSSPARLEVLDVMGRRILTRDVGALGPGRHSLCLGWGDGLPAGVYLIRLTQEGRSLTARAVVLR